MSIAVKNITKLYGSQKALDDVSFEVGRGQVVGFLGPNGAGKSTMMKILTCFIPQSSGQASVCGFDVTENPIDVRMRIGYLPEHNPLYPEMYIWEYLEFVAHLYGIKKDSGRRVRQMLEITGLGPEQKKKIGALSKGYRQRVGLAQAMIHEPEVLILDEPTSGLDPNQLTEIRSLIKSLGKEKTVMLSTHIMQEVEAISDRVIIINKGVIVADEQTSALKIQPASFDTVKIEFDRTLDRRLLMSIDGVKDAKNSGGQAWIITGKENTDLRSILFKWAVNNDYTVLSLQKEERKLEDIFQQLTGK